MDWGDYTAPFESKFNDKKPKAGYTKMPAVVSALVEALVANLKAAMNKPMASSDSSW